MEQTQGIYDELLKTKASVTLTKIQGRDAIIVQLPLGGCLIIEPNRQGCNRKTKEQIEIYELCQVAGIAWLQFSSPQSARLAVDAVLKKTRTKAEILRLAREYSKAANSYEDYESTESDAEKFATIEREMREMCEFLEDSEMMGGLNASKAKRNPSLLTECLK